MNLTDEVELCGDGDILSKEYKSLKIAKLICVESKTCNEMTNKGCNTEDRDMKGRKLTRNKQIFK